MGQVYLIMTLLALLCSNNLLQKGHLLQPFRQVNFILCTQRLVTNPYPKFYLIFLLLDLEIALSVFHSYRRSLCYKFIPSKIHNNSYKLMDLHNLLQPIYLILKLQSSEMTFSHKIYTYVFASIIYIFPIPVLYSLPQELLFMNSPCDNISKIRPIFIEIPNRNKN